MKVKKIMAIAVAIALIIGCVPQVMAEQEKAIEDKTTLEEYSTIEAHATLNATKYVFERAMNSINGGIIATSANDNAADDYSSETWETSGDFVYMVQENGTICITDYRGEAETVIIPDTIDGKKVTKICSEAFLFCRSIVSIEIPDSVTEIEDYVFGHCDSLTDIFVSEGNKNFSSQDGILYNKDKSQIITCPPGKAGELIILDSVTNIGNYAFVDCESLISIVLPNGVTSIGVGAFRSCRSLVSIKLPDGVVSIGNEAFIFCQSLASIEIPDSVTSIGGWAFYYCSSLTAIELPYGIASIGQYAFYYCKSLKSVIIFENVTQIASDAFLSRSDDLTIYGISGSYAETYATENNIKFNSIKLINSNGDSLGVEVLAPSSVPANSTLNVKKLSETEDGVTYEISLTADGKDVNLNREKAIVKIPVPEEGNTLEYKVYRREADGSYTDMEAIPSSRSLVFFTDHFSEYTVTAEKLIPDTITGDVNGDNTVNDRDSILLDRYLAEWGSEVIITASDLNDDGKVNDQDSIILARTLAGWYD